MIVYLVGGAVRDELLGLPVRERDWVVVGSSPEELQAQGYTPVGKDFPVFLHPQTKEEYALARTERKVGRGYHGFRFYAAPSVTLEQDLKRRDLTINAMARAPDGTLVDPYGGLRDLQERRLRHVSPAFAEDPVRVLRVARFAARFAPLGFTVAEETLALMRTMAASGEMDALVAERVWAELTKALAEPEPQVFFEVLRACGALAVLFPEIERLFGVPQPLRWHPEGDCGVHTLMVLQQAARLSPDPAVRFAALCHDLGKGTTPVSLLPHHHGHEARGAALVQALCARYRAPVAWRELAVMVARWHGHCHKLAALRPASVLRVLEATDAFRRPQRFADFLLACEADHRGRTGFEEQPYPQAAQWAALRAAAAAVDVRDVAATGAPGTSIARELRRRRTAAIAALHHPPATTSDDTLSFPNPCRNET